MLTPGLPTRPKHSAERGPCELVLSQQGAGTEDLLLMGQRRLAAGDWWCMCMLGVQLGGTPQAELFVRQRERPGLHSQAVA